MLDVRDPVAGEVLAHRLRVLPEVVDEGGVDKDDLPAFLIVGQRLAEDQGNEAAIRSDDNRLCRANDPGESVIEPSQSEVQVGGALEVPHSHQVGVLKKFRDPIFHANAPSRCKL